MKKSNSINLIIALVFAGTFGLACKGLMPSNTASNTNTASTPKTNTAENKPENTSTQTTGNSTSEKADFTVTAEDLDKEFTREGVTDKDLAKYENKYIAVSGRVSMLVTEKKGSVQPWVTLYAPGVLHGVSCYFDDKDVDQMKRLKEDAKVKVQGFQDDFIVPKISPRLSHCSVLEAN
jgi:hypothetical protein